MEIFYTPLGASRTPLHGAPGRDPLRFDPSSPEAGGGDLYYGVRSIIIFFRDFPPNERKKGPPRAVRGGRHVRAAYRVFGDPVLYLGIPLP